MSKVKVVANGSGGTPVNVEFHMVEADGGSWMHSTGSDFLFAFLQDGWSKELTAQVTAAFVQASTMSTKIKEAVLNTSGQTVVNGLYLQDQTAMTTAMNSIDGMGMTSADTGGESGSGTATEINAQFFTAILGGLGGDVEPMMAYLNSEMQNLQAQTSQSTVTDVFGTIVGYISVMPVLDVVTTTFQYVFSSNQTSQWFVSVSCGGSHESSSYDYQYTTVDYNYAPSAANL